MVLAWLVEGKKKKVVFFTLVFAWLVGGGEEDVLFTLVLAWLVGGILHGPVRSSLLKNSN